MVPTATKFGRVILWAVASVDIGMIIPAKTSDFHRHRPRCPRHFRLNWVKRVTSNSCSQNGNELLGYDHGFRSIYGSKEEADRYLFRR